MPLPVGTKLGPYEILAPIGKGGMGEVYQARDPRLRRDVAIKVSAEKFGQRFEQEAPAVAALDHSHICQIYDVGPNNIVMEFVEGEALAGPPPLDTAVNYERGDQTARALPPLFLTEHPDFSGERFIKNGNTIGWIRRFLEPDAWR